MAAVSTAIQLIDRMTAPILAITNSVNRLTNQFNALEGAANIDTAAMSAMQEQVNQTNAAAEQLNQTMQMVEDNINQMRRGQDNFNNSVRRGETAADGLISKIRSAVAAYATIKVGGNILALSDDLASTTARLNMVNDGMQTNQELHNKVFFAARRSGSSFLEMADSVAKIGSTVGDAFESTDEIIAFSELLSKSFAINPQDAQTQFQATRQLLQGLGSGRLRGDELVSVTEGAPVLAQAITEYMESLGYVGDIYELASQNLITTDVVKGALAYMADDINAMYDDMPITWARLWRDATDYALLAFQPFLKKLNDIANSPEVQSLLDTAINGFTVFADIAEDAIGGVVWLIDTMKPALSAVIGLVQTVYESFSRNWPLIEPAISAIADAIASAVERLNEFASSEAFQAFVDDVVVALGVVSSVVVEILDLVVWLGTSIIDNWSLVEPVIIAAATALGLYVAAMTVFNTVQTISTALKKIHAAKTALATGATLAQTSAQYGLNAALLASPLTWIIIVIAAIVAAIVVWAKHVGGFRVLWLIVVNAILTAWDWVQIGFFTGVYWVLDLWDKMKLGIITAATAIANFMGDMKAGVLTMFQSMVNGAIDIINGLIDVINNLPGIKIGAVEHVTFGTDAQSENEAKKMEREAALSDTRSKIEAEIEGRANALDAMKASARAATDERLAGIEEARAAAEDAVEQKDAGANLPSKDKFRKTTTFGGNTDYFDEIGNGVSNIDANTSKQLDYSEEVLKLWRDIAERETINEFTTAEVYVDFGGIINNVSSEMDLDGIVEYIGEHVEERLLEVAEGVHV